MSFRDILKAYPAKYAHIDFKPPKGAQEAARRGLELREEHKRGGIGTQEAGELGIGSGIQRANDLKSGDRMSPRSVRRMRNFFNRHRQYKTRGHHRDKTSASYISWQLWGGDAGDRWAQKVVEQMERADEKAKKK
jgi:hypothetical protein